MSSRTIDPYAAPAGEGSVQERLDRLSAQVADLAVELRAQREERARAVAPWAELGHDLSPVARDAFGALSAELEDLSRDVTMDDVARLARAVARAVPTLEALVVQLGVAADLGREALPLAGPAMASLTHVLDRLQERGYFTFARGGAQIADRVVASFTEDDVRALGDNIVLILQAVKEMTQPEVMQMLRRTMVTVQEGEDAYHRPPSVLALLRHMREPQVRSGLARVLDILGTIGAQVPATAAPPP
jgi:uncharacterized protein YjgD (DUF1641 family)